jgi:hypothetical protein
MTISILLDLDELTDAGVDVALAVACNLPDGASTD